MGKISRRKALIAAATSIVPVAANASPAPAVEERPVEKVTRLAWELAHALNEYADGTMHALVYPSAGRSFAVGFIVTKLTPRGDFDGH